MAASGDYTPIVNGTVTLDPGVTSTAVPVVIPAGTSIQPNRSFTVTLGACSTNVVVADAAGLVTINGAAPLQAPTRDHRPDQPDRRQRHSR